MTPRTDSILCLLCAAVASLLPTLARAVIVDVNYAVAVGQSQVYSVSDGNTWEYGNDLFGLASRASRSTDYAS
jgi:hypothetical protein